jgi:hypothetical protein
MDQSTLFFKNVLSIVCTDLGDMPLE